MPCLFSLELARIPRATKLRPSDGVGGTGFVAGFFLELVHKLMDRRKDISCDLQVGPEKKDSKDNHERMYLQLNAIS